MTAEDYKVFVDFYKNNPLNFFTDILDVKEEHLWDKMQEVANSVRDHQFTCVKAGNSLSKSYTLGRLALWYLYTHNPSTVVTTAPSNTQVEEILWREIRTAHANAKMKLGGEPTNTKLELAEKWFAYGFSTKPDTVTQHATKFQGFHNENVLIIFDEAAGILPQIWEAKDKLVTNPNVKFIAIGNPTVSKGDFVNCFRDKRYNKITISVFDSPNYKAGKEVVPGLSGVDFVEMVRDKYGEGSSYYKAMVTGEIPDEDTDSLIPLSWIERAEGRDVDHNFKFIKKFVVWDVADGGDDLHVIKAFQNTTEIDSVELRGKKVEEAEPYVWRLLRSIGGNCIVVDCDGIGRVAYQLLCQSKGKDVSVIAFEGSSRDVSEPQTFFNRRHEAHWRMRQLFEKNRISIAAHNETREELASIKLVEHSKGFIAVEKKKDLKERLNRSPDRADCIMMMAGAFDEIPILVKESFKYPNLGRYQEDYPFTPETV